MTKTISVKIRDVYGRAQVYPACTTSRLLAQLTGTKTFTQAHIATIRALGYTIAHAADCDLAARSALAPFDPAWTPSAGDYENPFSR